MDALLAALIAVGLVEQGDAMQLLGVRAAHQYARPGPVVAGLVAAAFANALVAAIGGRLVHDLVPYRALTLMLAVALLSAGAGALRRAKPPNVTAYERLGAFGGAAFAGLVLGFGGAAQFLVFAIAARTDSPVFAAIGGTLGMAAALVPVMLAGDRIAPVVARVRQGVAIVFLIAGAAIGLGALRLI